MKDWAVILGASSGIGASCAKELAKKKVVGWFNGSMEAGPRALGNRSILFNPKNKNGKDIVNKIKRREIKVAIPRKTES